MGLLNRENLKDIFQYLNERLKENQVKLTLTVYGGAIMTMVYDNRPATKDIDTVFGEINEKILNNILKTTGSVFGLEDGWINEEIKEPLKTLIKEDLETYQTYSNLTIIKPIAEQLLAMKILASRSEPSKDFVDAYILCKDLGITTKKELLDVCKRYYSLTMIGERQNIFIQYLGGDLGYDWE